MNRVILTLMIYSYISFFHQWNEFLLTIISLWKKCKTVTIDDWCVLKDLLKKNFWCIWIQTE